MSLENNQIVAIEYEVREAGKEEIIDGNRGGKPLEFLLGAGQIISGLEQALLGKNVGEKFEVTISPSDAYGERFPEYIQEVPREQFEGIELAKGMTLFGQGEDGQTVQVIVQDFNDKNVLIDYNHPLAGKNLHFDVTILSAREASEDELAGGMFCCGGDGHAHEHECCGGGHCAGH
ncbi:MAG: FKBP-type peptidyl-prolyl cis-trans isomerase [Wolinella sp.]